MAEVREVPARWEENSNNLDLAQCLDWSLFSQEGLCMDAQAALDYLHTREDIASDRWVDIYFRALYCEELETLAKKL